MDFSAWSPSHTILVLFGIAAFMRSLQATAVALILIGMAVCTWLALRKEA